MSTHLGRKGALLLAAVVIAALAVVVGACGEEQKSHVVEGEPIELGELEFNVSLTRFLNPNDTEDAEYLEGEPDPSTGQVYLGVFMTVHNASDDDVTLPTAEQMEVVDTTSDQTGTTYHPTETETVFGFPFGETLGGGEDVPGGDSAAANGPINGAVIIFLVDQGVSENRPLELELSADGEDGSIELDI